MHSLWTPDGEHRVGGPGRPTPTSQRAAPQRAEPDSGRGPDAPAPEGEGMTDEWSGAIGDEDLTEEEAAMAAHLDELRGQLLSAPAEVVVANHAYGLFELAAMHLSQQPPHLEQARLAIDALGALVETLTGRLGEAEPSLVEAMSQIRLAFVQIQATHTGGDPPGPGPD